MSYGSGNYGATEYAGVLLGSAAEAPPSAVTPKHYVVGREGRWLVVHRQDDPVVVREDRRVRAMPSAIVELRTFVKDPEAMKSYGVDWSELLDEGETISSSGWSATGLSLSSAQISGAVTSVMIAGGTLGQTYLVENNIQTSLGRIYTRGFMISVERT
jgi:hypothetical protein